VEGELITFSPGVRLLLSTFNPMNAQYMDALEQVDVIVRHLSQMARVILLDLGPSMTPFVRTVLPHCDNIVVIFEPFIATLQQSKFLLDGLKGLGFTKERVDLVSLNRVRTGTQPTIEQLSRKLDHPISVYIPPAPELAMQATTRKTPIVIQDPESITSQQINKLAGVIIEKDTRPDE
jgi:pilus assembly protein CpaE